MTNSFRTVPRFPNYAVSRDGKVKNTKRGTMKKPTRTGFGYQYVVLWHEGRQKKFYIHRLVYEVHVGPIPDGKHIHHKNNKSDDNRVDNLELVEPEKNLYYRWSR